MHAYLITAKPNRWQRYVRAARHWTPRLLAAAALLLLGLVVFALRAARALLNLAATVAAHIEFEAAARAGRPPLGQILGAALAEAFTTEFRRGFATPPAA